MRLVLALPVCLAQSLFAQTKSEPDSFKEYQCPEWFRAADGKGQWWDGLDPAELYNHPKSAKNSPPVEWKELWLKRHTDLVDKYQPDLLYFDGGIPHPPYGPRRAGAKQQQEARTNYWQTDTSVGRKSWSHIQSEEFKSPKQFINGFVDVVSKNGNYLLNIERARTARFPTSRAICCLPSVRG